MNSPIALTPRSGHLRPRYHLVLVLFGLGAALVSAGLGALSGLNHEAIALVAAAALALGAVVWLRRWPLWITLALIAWLPFQNIVVAELVWAGRLSNSAAQLLTIFKEIGLVGMLAALVLSGRTWRLGLADVLFLLFAGLVVSYLPRGDLSLTARIAVVRMLVIPLMLYFVGRFLPGKRAPRYVLGVGLLTATLVAGWGWFELAAVDVTILGNLQAASAAAKGQSLPVLGRDLAGAFYTVLGSALTGEVVWVRRMISTYLEPLSLGHALILPITFLFYALLAARPPLVRPRWLNLSLLVFLALTQVMAISRGALLASLLAAGIITLISRRTRTVALAFLGVVLVAALVVPTSRNFILSTIRLEDPSSIAHASALQAGWAVALQRPLGFGLGHGGYVATQFSAGSSEGTGESFYFAMISQVGVVGAALFVGGTLRLLSGLWQISRNTTDPWLQAAAVITMAALTGYSFSAIFSEAAFSMLASGAVWLMAGLVMQAGYAEFRGQAAVEPPPPDYP